MSFQDQLSLNAGQKYCKMLQGEHSAILSTFIMLPFVNKVLSIFERPLKTGFTVYSSAFQTRFFDGSKQYEHSLIWVSIVSNIG